MKYFLVLGNTRIGSTWLTYAIHSLPGAFCMREIRWRMPYQEELPQAHTYVDSTTRSVKERLDFGFSVARRREEIVAIGAKLKVDPYGFAPPATFATLGNIIEDDVYLILLRRPYIEILGTWKAFGIRHLANPKARKKLEKKMRDKGVPRTDLNRYYSMHSVPPIKTNIVLTHNGKIVSRLTRAIAQLGESEKIMHYPIRDAIDDLLVFFFNDVFLLSLTAGRSGVDVLDYRDIETRFFDIVQKLSLPAMREQCREALDNAATLKIEPPGVRLVHPDEALTDISEYLDAVFHDIREGRLGVDDVLTYDEGNETVTFHLPRLPDILARHEETANLAPVPTSRGLGLLRGFFGSRSVAATGDWRAHRRVFVPVA